MQLVDENPYGAEFDVRLRPAWAESDSISALASALEKRKGVECVLSDTGIIDNVNHNLQRLSWIMLGIAAALMVISFVLINNTVSLAVYSRRFVIHTMRLVGATSGFIRRPFLRAGACTGLLAAVVASAVLAGLQAYALRIDTALAGTLYWEDSLVVYGLLTIVGVLICLLASAFATTRYLRHDVDDYYMN
ncbi:MAG: cell division protein FtsX, partial [Muribaculaceae bacterium]|nr:cell division protein FtsX [Muribaculaceae bacterium]